MLVHIKWSLIFQSWIKFLFNKHLNKNHDSKHMLTYVDQLDAVLLDGVEGDGDVLERVGLRLWPLVVSQLSLLQSLHEGN